MRVLDLFVPEGEAVAEWVADAPEDGLVELPPRAADVDPGVPPVSFLRWRQSQCSCFSEKGGGSGTSRRWFWWFGLLDGASVSRGSWNRHVLGGILLGGILL